jgi:hypothetical protein
MDFENTRLLDNISQYALIESYDKFYYDLIKFFTFMPTFIQLLTYKSISPITNYISILNEKGKKISYEHIIDIFKLIDNIDFVLNKNDTVST